MKNWFDKNYKKIIISAFLIPIITVAIVSISHVTIWYGISNPISWAVYLSVGIEIAALSALAAISADMGSKVYFPFGIVTLIQFIGNIYFSYQFIDIEGDTFKDWVELVSPLLEYIGVESTDFIGHKRFLSLFAGGMLPVISLSFLHMLVKFTQGNKNNGQEINPAVDAKEIIGEVSRVRLSEEDLKILEKMLDNPPAPNEKLKNAVKEYKQKINDQITDAVTTKQPEVIPVLSDDEVYQINPDELERKLDTEDENANQQEDWNSYNKLIDLQLDTPITPSTAPKSATEMMITTNDDAVKSIPSDEEKSEMDMPVDTQPVAIEELPENQPIADSPNPEINNEGAVPNTDTEEKKKN